MTPWRCPDRLRNPIEWIRQQKFLLGMTAQKIGWLITDIQDDRIAFAFDLRADGRLEVDSRFEVRPIGHHVERFVAGISSCLQVAHRRLALVLGAADDEEDSHVLGDRFAEDLKGGLDCRIVGELIPRRPTAWAVAAALTGADDRPTEIVPA